MEYVLHSVYVIEDKDKDMATKREKASELRDRCAMWT
jgi:hypothetical protein